MKEKKNVKYYIKEFGLPGIITYAGIYLAGIPLWYCGLTVFGIDITPLAEWIGSWGMIKTRINDINLAKGIDVSFLQKKEAGLWVTAFLLNELSEPARIPLTVLLVMKYRKMKKTETKAASE